VLIDGREVGRTPVTARNIGRGAHTLRLVRDGYEPAERRVSVTSKQPSPSVSVQLAPERAPAKADAAPVPSSSKTTGSLFIESRPARASVTIDGKPSGTTPMLLDGLNPGEHMIQIDSTGYRRWTSSVRIVPGERTRIAASLER
jgi:hypothetical protein